MRNLLDEKPLYLRQPQIQNEEQMNLIGRSMREDVTRHERAVHEILIVTRLQRPADLRAKDPDFFNRQPADDLVEG